MTEPHDAKRSHGYGTRSVAAAGAPEASMSRHAFLAWLAMGAVGPVTGVP